MAGDRSRYGLLVSSLGAVLLAVSVFLPWYGVSFTATGIAYVQQLGDHIAAQYGNAALQGLFAGLHPDLTALAGRQFASVSAHQVLKDLNVVLLVVAGLALLDALLPLVRSTTLPDGAGGSLPLLGCVAGACVLFRLFDPPTPAGNLLALSPREGVWLALLGSLAVLAGGVWPRVASAEPPALSDTRLRSTWSGLSGWTPGA